MKKLVFAALAAVMCGALLADPIRAITPVPQSQDPNNGGDSAEDVAAGIKRIIDICREKHPEAKMLLLPIFPRAENAKNNHRIKNEKTNEIIKGYVDGKNVLWCDFNDKFLEPGPDKVLPRSIMPDLLHPNHDGYLIWEAAVRPFFEKL